ncbi:hypothetical protein EES43_23695 [Streptomyces sp. ADI96-02]|uniref:hypothetical protein n=1 Tax=Streptomyces sp. ADI96-02 TaxID=1522760 RepID=UPI000FB030A7|nr:hypothetical protein [Streptomyces sp. ADI96-02]RPK56829.1 hypothetical protein EES43_23695 [Streptomyces sp. ADI96-02]
MNSRQRTRRLSRLRTSPGFPPDRRRRSAVPAEGTTPATPRTGTPDSTSSDTA